MSCRFRRNSRKSCAVRGPDYTTLPVADILEYAQILYTAANPISHGFDVIVARYRFDLDQNHHESARIRYPDYLIIRAIVYTEPSKGKWEVLSESSKAHVSITAALQEFTKDLERKMGDVTGTEVRTKRERDEEDLQANKRQRVWS